DLDRVAGDGDDRRGRSRQAEDLHGDLALVLAQEVVDRQALEHVAAGAVDVDRDRPLAEAPQRARDALGGDPLARPVVVADDVVHADGAIGLLGGGGADAGVPAVQRARLELAADAGAHAPLRRARQLLDRHGVSPSGGLLRSPGTRGSQPWPDWHRTPARSRRAWS